MAKKNNNNNNEVKKWRKEWKGEWGLEKQTEGLDKKAVKAQKKIVGRLKGKKVKENK